MQTKKRAKPVKFGKQGKEEVVKKTTEPEEKKVIEEKVEEEVKVDTKVEKEEVPEEKETKSKEDKEEIDTEEDLDEEPKEIKLSEEVEEVTNSDEADKDPKNVEVEKEEVIESEPEKEVTETKEIIEEQSEDKPSPFGSFRREEVGARKKSPIGFFLLVALIAFTVGLGLIAGGSYFLSTMNSDGVKLPSIQEPTATPTPTSEPTPTPKAADLSAYSIQVLNGSGITGEAAKLQTQLDDAGFDVSNVGNAGTSDYTKTVVAAKADVDDAYLTELINELKKTYQVNSVTESLPDSKTTDVVVTIGSSTAN